MSARVRIEFGGDGPARYGLVTVDGKPLTCVTAADIQLDARDGATVRLTVIDVDLDITAEVLGVDVDHIRCRTREATA